MIEQKHEVENILVNKTWYLDILGSDWVKEYREILDLVYVEFFLDASSRSRNMMVPIPEKK